MKKIRNFDNEASTVARGHMQAMRVKPLVAVCAAIALGGSMLPGCSDGNDSSNADFISTANAGDGTSCGAGDTLEAGLQGDVNQRCNEIGWLATITRSTKVKGTFGSGVIITSTRVAPRST